MPYGTDTAAVVNYTSSRSVYPAAAGRTIGAVANPSANAGHPQAAPMAGYNQTNFAGIANSEVGKAAAIGSTGNPLVVWGIMLVGLVALMIVAKKFGGEGDKFAHISPGIYNILVISWAAILGINVFKALFTLVKVPGLSTLALNA